MTAAFSSGIIHQRHLTMLLQPPARVRMHRQPITTIDISIGTKLIRHRERGVVKDTVINTQ